MAGQQTLSYCVVGRLGDVVELAKERGEFFSHAEGPKHLAAVVEEVCGYLGAEHVAMAHQSRGRVLSRGAVLRIRHGVHGKIVDAV